MLDNVYYLTLYTDIYYTLSILVAFAIWPYGGQSCTSQYVHIHKHT